MYVCMWPSEAGDEVTMTELPPLSVARLAVVRVTVWVCCTTVPPFVPPVPLPEELEQAAAVAAPPSNVNVSVTNSLRVIDFVSIGHLPSQEDFGLRSRDGVHLRRASKVVAGFHRVRLMSAAANFR